MRNVSVGSWEEVIKKRKSIVDKVIKEATEFSNVIRKVIGKVTLIIYGSYARGDFNLWSDVDVILISEYFTNIDFLKRYDIISKFIPENFEVKIWTLQEAKRNLSKPWWKEALRNRIVIVDDYGLFT